MSVAKVARKRQRDIREVMQQCAKIATKSNSGVKEKSRNVEENNLDPTPKRSRLCGTKDRIDTDFLNVSRKSCIWREIRRENLYLQICDIFYSRAEANALLAACEQELTYYTGDLAVVHIFGKRIDIPRKQVAHGDPGLTYTFSGNTIPAQPWTPLLMRIRDHISQVTGHTFNFVLINRYKDGHDYVGDHKDDERNLVQGHPIASLTLGQPRDFVFKHQDSRGKNAICKIEPVSVQLEHGMLLLMNHPTNSYWYHSIPRRSKALGLRVSLTYRKVDPSHCKPVKTTKYKDGHDYMGEHKDDEKDLVPDHPIASLSLGQTRDFVFKHQDSRGKNAKRKIDPIMMQLEHGMLLLMKHPTNTYWYHSLPRRTRAVGIRINMTFRKMEPAHCTHAKIKN